MSKSYYLPRTDEQKATWLNNFAIKLPALITKYNITGTEQLDIVASAAYFDGLVKLKNQFVAFQAALTAYKNAMRDGDATVSTVFPQVPMVTLPAAPAFDIFGRVASVVAKIKANYQYSETDGQSLGIIGAEQAALDVATLIPLITVVLTSAGQPQIVWKKNGMTSLEIEVNRGAGWEYLATDTIPDYTDGHPLPPSGQTAVWTYRAIYRLGDEQHGQWSNPVSFSVAGR